MIFFQKTILQRFASTTLIVCLLFSIVGTALLLPKKAEAIPVTVTTIATDIWTIFQTAMDKVWSYIQESYEKLSSLSLEEIAAWAIWDKAQRLIKWALGVAANLLLEQLLSELTNQIVEWIQGGGEPRFLSEGLGDWLGEAANNAAGNFVDQYLGAGWLCEPFDLDIEIALRDVPTFVTEVECTLTDIVDNIDDFYDDFTTGGWKGWIELTKPQNTFAGAYLLAKDEKMFVMSEEIKEMEKDLEMGDGFLSPKDCYWYSADGDLVETQTDVWGSAPLPSDCQPDSSNKGYTTGGYVAPCQKICQVNTPASVVRDVTSKSVTNFWDKMNARITAAMIGAGPYEVYIQAIADALINRVLTEGKGLLNSDETPSPKSGDLGESENLPTTVDTEDNYTTESSVNELLSTLDSLKESLEDYLTPQQEDNLAAWELVYDAYTNETIPALDNILNSCDDSSAEYAWAEDERNDLTTNVLPAIEEEISELETAISGADEVISLIDSAIISVENLNAAIEEWEALYEESSGLETDEIIAAQEEIDAAQEVVVGDIQNILSVLNSIITSADFDETADEIEDLSDEIYDAMKESLSLYADLAGEIGDPTYPNAGTIYAELEYADELTTEAEASALDCDAGGGGGGGGGTVIGDSTLSITWNCDSLIQKADGSDNWPITWADDDNQYTAWGDGWGFSESGDKKSLGVSKVSGSSASSFTGADLETWKENGAEGGIGKSYGILSVAGTLYMWIGYGGDGSGLEAWKSSKVYKSTDHGKNWTGASWYFTVDNDVTNLTFMQFGKNYGDNQDGYVYVYAPDLVDVDWSSDGYGDYPAMPKPGKIILMRVPKDKIMTESNYEFFAGIDADDNPSWVSSLSNRVPVLENSKGVGWTMSAIYYPAIDRYILMTEHTASHAGNLAIYDAPNPWGPWTTVAEYTNWCGFSTTFYWNISPKWISGNDFTLVFTGSGDYDAWNTITGTIK